MKGIKAHTHAEREELIRKLVPLINQKFADNLVALAVCCSFARGEDFNYSDLELIAFVKSMPEGKKQGGLAKIFDGMLIEIVWMTGDTYLNTVLDVNEYWHYSGSNILQPIINEEYIANLNAFKPRYLKSKCLDHAVGLFSEVQEAASKVLNAIEQENRENMPLLFSDFLNQVLRNLSFINQEPFTTASKMISQARGFCIKPESINNLLDMAVKGSYSDLDRLQKVTIAVFEELESIFEELSLQIYDDDIDLEKLVNKLRKA